MSEFEPRIIGFLCNWCGYAGADLAGVSRFQYPPNIRIIRVMCSGRVDPVIVLEMFENGADGVLIVGCHTPSDCHYKHGNFYCERKVKMLKRLIALTGMEPQRLRLEWVSAAEGQRFADIVKDFVSQIKRLGPSPLRREKPDERLLFNIQAAKQAASWSRLRMLVGREIKLTEEANVYGEKIDQKRFDRLMKEAIEEEYARSMIYLLIKNKPMSVDEISKSLNLDSLLILQHIVTLKRKGLLDMESVKGYTPIYRAIEVI